MAGADGENGQSSSTHAGRCVQTFLIARAELQMSAAGAVFLYIFVNEIRAKCPWPRRLARANEIPALSSAEALAPFARALFLRGGGGGGYLFNARRPAVSPGLTSVLGDRSVE